MFIELNLMHKHDEKDGYSKNVRVNTDHIISFRGYKDGSIVYTYKISYYTKETPTDIEMMLGMWATSD